jgi:hypothetical protein
MRPSEKQTRQDQFFKPLRNGRTKNNQRYDAAMARPKAYNPKRFSNGQWRFAKATIPRASRKQAKLALIRNCFFKEFFTL